MQPRGLYRIETKLGFDLPRAYRNFIAELEKLPRFNKPAQILDPPARVSGDQHVQ